MTLTVQALARVRPFAFHVASEVNLASIRQSGQLRSAHGLLIGTPHEGLLRSRRSQSSIVLVGGRHVEIRDHRPLVLKSLKLPSGYSADDFLAELNSRVFFWAGTEAGPVKSGRNHWQQYSTRGRVFLIRVPTIALIEANCGSELEVTLCNSGSARHNKGLPAERGPSTFASLAETNRPASAVVELTFKNSAFLPTGTEFSASTDGPWAMLGAGG